MAQSHPTHALLRAVSGEAQDIFDETARIDGALRSSGRASQAWSLQAKRLLEEWSTQVAAEMDGRATLAAPECFGAGCRVVISLDSVETHDDIGRSAMEYFPMRWEGVRIYTGPLSDDAGAHAWLILAPEPTSD